MSIYHQNKGLYPTHITLRVKDKNRSKSFYQNIMGFHILSESDFVIHYGFDSLNPILTTVIDPVATPRVPEVGLYHVAYLLPNLDALSNWLNHIALSGYPITGGADHGISNAIYLDDPDGNGIEVYVDTNPTFWIDIESHPEKLENKPLDYRALLNLNKEPFNGQSPKTIIGHVHLHTSDLDKASDFYQSVLGFNLIVSMPSAHFLSYNGYHHHLGINTWAKKTLPKPNSVGLVDITYTVNGDLKSKIEANLRHHHVPYVVTDEGLKFKDTDQNTLYFK